MRAPRAKNRVPLQPPPELRMYYYLTLHVGKPRA